MTTRNLRLCSPFILAAAMLFLGAALGCVRAGAGRRSGAVASRIDPARVYAGYHFDTAPDVLSLGVQPLWIPACVIWEVMARDEQLREDLHQAHCRLKVYPFFKGQDLNSFLRTGKLQGGMSGDLPALKAATEFDVRIVSLVQQGPCSLIAREGLRLEALRGRRIGYAPGSNAHYALLRILREQGLTPVQVRLIPMDMISMAGALAAGRIDAFSAWEPTPTLALLDHPSFDVLARTDARGYLSFTGAFFERKPEAARAVVAAEIRALRWLRTNEKNVYIASGWARERAVAFSRAELPLTVYDFDRLARRDVLRVPEAPRLLPELLAPSGEITQQFRLSRELGMIAAAADWNRVRQSFALDVVPEIIAAAPRYHLDELRLGRSMTMSGQ